MTISHFYEPMAGELLYHYTSAAGALGILNSKALWLSDYRQMNDSREYLYAKECLLAALKKRIVYLDQRIRISVVTDIIGLESHMLMLIGCLTRQADSPHQWLHYADGGEGCVLGIDAEYLATEAGVATKVVNYDPAYLQKIVHVGLSMLQQELEANPNDLEAVAELTKWLATDLFSFKQAKYAPEQEVRISRLVHRDFTSKYGFADGGGHGRNGVAVPPLDIHMRNGGCRYIELPLALNGSLSIRSIGFGPKCATPTRSNIEDLARALSADINFWESTAPVSSSS